MDVEKRSVCLEEAVSGFWGDIVQAACDGFYG